MAHWKFSFLAIFLYSFWLKPLGVFSVVLVCRRQGKMWFNILKTENNLN
jgi:ABC-type transport system involved in cytochrome c biogenesis permease subunit